MDVITVENKNFKSDVMSALVQENTKPLIAVFKKDNVTGVMISDILPNRNMIADILFKILAEAGIK